MGALLSGMAKAPSDVRVITQHGALLSGMAKAPSDVRCKSDHTVMVLCCLAWPRHRVM